jgi:predicted SprT family Zn-dependent metalloprotease
MNPEPFLYLHLPPGECPPSLHLWRVRRYDRRRAGFLYYCRRCKATRWEEQRTQTKRERA